MTIEIVFFPKALPSIFFGWICFVAYVFAYAVLIAIDNPAPAAWLNTGTQIILDLIIFVIGAYLALSRKSVLFLVFACIGLSGAASDGAYEYLVNVRGIAANTDPRAVSYFIPYAVYLVTWFAAWSIIFAGPNRSKITPLSLTALAASLGVFSVTFAIWFIKPVLNSELASLVKVFHSGFTICQILNVSLAFVCLMATPTRSVTLLTLGYGVVTATDLVLRTKEILGKLGADDPFEVTWTLGLFLVVCSLVIVRNPPETAFLPERDSKDVHRVIGSIALVPTLVALSAVVLIQSRELLVFSLFLTTLFSAAIYYYFSPSINAIVLEAAKSLAAGQTASGNPNDAGHTVILFLGAGQSDEVQLRLTKEANAIGRHLRSVKFHEKFRLEPQFDVQARQIPELIMRIHPRVIHFSGHCSSDGKLQFLDEMGRSQAIEPTVLARTLELHKYTVKCVVLNACYASVLAEALVKSIDVVVGMSDEIGDEDAIAFSSAFYEAIGYGKNVFDSFEIAKNAIDLSNLLDSQIPTLHSRQGVNPNEIFLS
jgi:hypothetical protein